MECFGREEERAVKTASAGSSHAVDKAMQQCRDAQWWLPLAAFYVRERLKENQDKSHENKRRNGYTYVITITYDYDYVYKSS